jgi:hypothetical protein
LVKARNIKLENIDINEKVGALHRYWVRADAIRELIKKNQIFGIRSRKNRLIYDLDIFLIIETYYSLLYVVIEGYKEINIEDKNINILLQENNYVDFLRLFRNSIFHYQKEPISEKTLKFLETKDSEIWINKLNIALKKYFEENLKIKEIYDIFKKKSTKSLLIAVKRLFNKYFKHSKNMK